jgi:hypothetical protein
MDTLHGALGATSGDGSHLLLSHWLTRLREVRDYEQRMLNLVSLSQQWGPVVQEACLRQLPMMWTVGQLLRHSGSTAPGCHDTILGDSGLTTMRQAAG